MSFKHADSISLSPRTYSNVIGDRICLVQGNDYTGHRAYYFLQLNPLKIPQFKKASTSTHSFDLESYGEIIVSGYGEEVPENVLIKMRTQYGWVN
jgi:hypothetical protein